MARLSTGEKVPQQTLPAIKPCKGDARASPEQENSNLRIKLHWKLEQKCRGAKESSGADFFSMHFTDTLYGILIILIVAVNAVMLLLEETPPCGKQFHSASVMFFMSYLKSWPDVNRCCTVCLLFLSQSWWRRCNSPVRWAEACQRRAR